SRHGSTSGFEKVLLERTGVALLYWDGHSRTRGSKSPAPQSENERRCRRSFQKGAAHEVSGPRQPKRPAYFVRGSQLQEPRTQQATRQNGPLTSCAARMSPHASCRG